MKHETAARLTHAGVFGALAGACLAGLLACRPAPAPAPGPTILKIGTSLPPTADQSTGVNGIINALALQSPISTGWNGRPMPRAFDRWEWLPDGLGLKVHIAPGIRFHDGSPLTAETAARALRPTFLDPKRRTAISSSIESITPVSDSEVIIRTRQREGFLLSDLATSTFSLPNQPAIGTGPFIVERSAPNVVLRAFDQYQVGRPAIDRVEILRYDTQRAAWAAMMRGDINMLHDVSREALDFVEAESTLQTHSFLRAYYYALAFNVRHPVLRRREVRQSLSEAVNRARIVEQALKGRGEAAYTPIWPYHWANSPSQRPYQFNPDLARIRLETIGLGSSHATVPGRMPGRFHFKCLVVQEDATLQTIAMLVQKDLFDIGVDMQVELVPLREWARRMHFGQFDAALAEFTSSKALTYLYVFWYSQQSNAPMDNGYSGADRALERFRAAITDEEIRSSLADVTQALADDPPAVFIAWMQTARALTRDFVVPDEGPSDILGTLPQWRPVPPKQLTRR